MKSGSFMLIALTMGATPTSALAPPPRGALEGPVARLGHGDELLTAVIQLVHVTNPEVPAGRAARIATRILAECDARGLDPLILAGIIAQESHFHASVRSCQGGFCDYGLGQVNWETWHATLGLDRRRLAEDDDYNIAVSARILADTRDRFGGGPGWWTRYHDHRPDRRLVYGRAVRSHAPALFGRI